MFTKYDPAFERLKSLVFIIKSFVLQALPPKSKFAVEDIPDLTGRVAIVTGANTGLGKATAKALLEHNATVYIAARSKEKAEAAIQDLKQQTGKEAVFLKLDLADLLSVKAAAAEFLSKEKELHILFNNGGVMYPPFNQVTAQGYDLQFGTNVLGHIYLTQLLIPALISAAKSSPDGKARVVNTASSAHLFGYLNFNTFKDGPARKKCTGNFLYSQSKYGNIVFANELARRYSSQDIISTSCNPGNLHSNLFRHVPGFAVALLRFWLYSPAYGALTQLWAGTSVEGADLNGKYLIPWARIGQPLLGTQDPELGKQLWKWAEEQTENI